MDMATPWAPWAEAVAMRESSFATTWDSWASGARAWGALADEEPPDAQLVLVSAYEAAAAVVVHLSQRDPNAARTAAAHGVARRGSGTRAAAEALLL